MVLVGKKYKMLYKYILNIPPIKIKLLSIPFCYCGIKAPFHKSNFVSLVDTILCTLYYILNFSETFIFSYISLIHKQMFYIHSYHD